MNNQPIGPVRLIPLEQIDILNSRERDARVFGDIVGNIKSIGIKKPITVTERQTPDGGLRYLLVCGEGRVNAMRQLGEIQIPALVVEANDEDAFLMSLVENIARRQYRPLELLSGIEQLRDRGYDKKTIARKTGLSLEYVNGILTLLRHGEERLLLAVQNGRIPLSAAIAIAGAGDDNNAVQAALQDAYESGKLRGRKLLAAKRIVERRQSFGRVMTRSERSKQPDVTSSSLVRNYQKEVLRQRQIVKRAEASQQRLLFVVGALRQLLSDENFTNLLRVEGLQTMPKFLSEKIAVDGSEA